MIKIKCVSSGVMNPFRTDFILGVPPTQAPPVGGKWMKNNHVDSSILSLPYFPNSENNWRKERDIFRNNTSSKIRMYSTRAKFIWELTSLDLVWQIRHCKFYSFSPICLHITVLIDACTTLLWSVVEIIFRWDIFMLKKDNIIFYFVLNPK